MLALRHCRHLRALFHDVHLLSVLVDPSREQLKTYRDAVNRRLRTVRGFLADRVPAMSSSCVIDVVPNIYFRIRPGRWLKDVQGRPNPLKKLLGEYLQAGYAPLNGRIPEGGFFANQHRGTHFDFAVRMSSCPDVVPYLISLGADEELVQTDVPPANASDHAGAPTFLDFVDICARARMHDKDADVALAHAELCRAKAHEALLLRSIDRVVAGQALPAPAPRHRRPIL